MMKYITMLLIGLFSLNTSLVFAKTSVEEISGITCKADDSNCQAAATAVAAHRMMQQFQQ
jgi:hypothetical protein